jgi:hypothetical protein
MRLGVSSPHTSTHTNACTHSSPPAHLPALTALASVLRERQLGGGILVSTRIKPTSSMWTLRDPAEVAAFLKKLLAWGESDANAWHSVANCNGWSMAPHYQRAQPLPPSLPQQCPQSSLCSSSSAGDGIVEAVTSPQPAASANGFHPQPPPRSRDSMPAGFPVHDGAARAASMLKDGYQLPLLSKLSLKQPQQAHQEAGAPHMLHSAGLSPRGNGAAIAPTLAQVFSED